MSDIQYPETGEKNVNFSAKDDCGNKTRGTRMITIIQKLLAGRYVDITESGDTATISVDPSADYYNKAEINELLGDLDTVQFKIVTALPAVGALNVIYLVAKTAPDTGYDQYIWNTDDAQFHPIGDTDIDLSDYYTKLQTYQKSEVYNKTEADDKFQEKLTDAGAITPVTDTTTFSNLNLATKVAKSITGLSVWNYIVSKITGSASSAITTNLERSKVVVTDANQKLNVSGVYSAELEQLSGINTTKTVQRQLNEKQDVFTYSGEIAAIDDDTGLGVVNLYAKTVSTIIGSTIWTYIKSKITNGTITSITDTTKLGSIDTSKTNIVQETTAKDLYDYMWKKIYPVGAIYISYSSTSPATLFGGTWTQISGKFLVASGSANYSYVNTSGSSTTGTVTFTATNTGGSPRVQLTTDTMPKHQHGLPYRKCGSYSGTDWRTDPGSVDGYAGNTVAAGGGSYPSGYGAPFNQLPPYLVVYMWRRTA